MRWRRRPKKELSREGGELLDQAVKELRAEGFEGLTRLVKDARAWEARRGEKTYQLEAVVAWEDKAKTKLRVFVHTDDGQGMRFSGPPGRDFGKSRDDSPPADS